MSRPCSPPALPLLACCLAVLALALPGEAVAGPPEGVSGRMVLASDDVADGLRRYRHALDPATRLALMQKLAPTRDPRVALALWEAIPKEPRGLTPRECRMAGLLNEYFVRGAKVDGKKQSVWDWWKENEADLRRRAEQLPK